MAVDLHLAQLHGAGVGSWRRYDRDGGVQIPVTQTEWVSKWNIQSFQRNGEVSLQDIAIDANRGNATRFSIGRNQRIDVRGG